MYCMPKIYPQIQYIERERETKMNSIYTILQVQDKIKGIKRLVMAASCVTNISLSVCVYVRT